MTRTALDGQAGFDVTPVAPGGPALRSHVPCAIQPPLARRIGVLALAHQQPLTAEQRKSRSILPMRQHGRQVTSPADDGPWSGPADRRHRRRRGCLRPRRNGAAKGSAESPIASNRSASARARSDSGFSWRTKRANVVGMAAAMPSRDDFGEGDVVPGLCYLDLIFVVPERWGDGIGALLLDTVIADARGRGFSASTCSPTTTTSRAQGLYVSRGFERTGWSRMSTDPANGPVSEWARPL